MTIMKPDQKRVQLLLVDTISLLCKNGLQFKTGLKVQGLLGVTVDNSEVFIVHIDENFTNELNAAVNVSHGSGDGQLAPTSRAITVDDFDDDDEDNKRLEKGTLRSTRIRRRSSQQWSSPNTGNVSNPNCSIEFNDHRDSGGHVPSYSGLAACHILGIPDGNGAASGEVSANFASPSESAVHLHGLENGAHMSPSKSGHGSLVLASSGGSSPPFRPHGSGSTPAKKRPSLNRSRFQAMSFAQGIRSSTGARVARVSAGIVKTDSEVGGEAILNDIMPMLTKQATAGCIAMESPVVVSDDSQVKEEVEALIGDAGFADDMLNSHGVMAEFMQATSHSVDYETTDQSWQQNQQAGSVSAIDYNFMATASSSQQRWTYRGKQRSRLELSSHPTFKVIVGEHFSFVTLSVHALICTHNIWSPVL